MASFWVSIWSNDNISPTWLFLRYRGPISLIFHHHFGGVQNSCELGRPALQNCCHSLRGRNLPWHLNEPTVGTTWRYWTRTGPKRWKIWDPLRIHGTIVYLPTWMVDFYGKLVGKHIIHGFYFCILGSLFGWLSHRSSPSMTGGWLGCLGNLNKKLQGRLKLDPIVQDEYV